MTLLVLLNAMVPAPGESPSDWWANTGHAIFHDVPPEVTAEAMARGEPVQSGTPFAQPWPLRQWPRVATRLLQGSDDRFSPVEFQRRVARDRLGITPDEMPGGHLVALSRPKELVDRLEAYWADQEPG